MLLKGVKCVTDEQYAQLRCKNRYGVLHNNFHLDVTYCRSIEQKKLNILKQMYV